MFTDLIQFPIQSERLQWEARQVMRDLDYIPHLLLRLKLTGTHFPQRALEPFVKVGEVRSRFVTISDDGLNANAYFDQSLTQGCKVEFGYGQDILLRFPRSFNWEVVRLLDPNRLPIDTKLMVKASSLLQ